MSREYYFYGVAAAVYIAACWIFLAIRWFHTCSEPKEQHAQIWPDRWMQCVIYSMATLLLPYAIDPTDPSAWLLYKSYFPTAYYFYCGALMFCYFGTGRQWNRWKTASWVAAIITLLAIGPLVMNAWMSGSVLSEEGIHTWSYVVTVVGLIMMAFAAVAMWQVWRWMEQSRDENFSNPDDFPMDYARRVWLAPVIFTPLLWPAYIWDSPATRAFSDLLLTTLVVIMLIIVLPAWRRTALVPSSVEDNAPAGDPLTDAHHEELINQTAIEIETYVRDQQAFLNSHLKIDDVSDHCQLGRSYVSLTFSRRFGSFASYVNRLRLQYYEQYITDHPNETKEAAARASGFSSYLAYYRSKQKLDREGSAATKG